MTVDLIKQQILTDYHEILICRNCAIIIANADCGACISDSDRDANGEACPESAAIAARYPGDVWCVVVGEDADTGFRPDWCGTCGEYIATDEWVSAEAFKH